MYPEDMVHNYATELATGLSKRAVSSQAPLEVLVRACKRQVKGR